MKRKDFLVYLLIIQMLIGCGSTKKISYDTSLPNPAPMRLGPVESMTYTGYLEKGKRYKELLNMLNTELAAIEILEISIKHSNFLQPSEVDAVKKFYSHQGDKDPMTAFLKRHQINSADNVCDLEGKLYLMDDLAQLYTTGLINFKKAQAYNQKAKEIYLQIKATGIENMPLSDYFNERRAIYYTFFKRPVGEGWDTPPLPDDYKIFPQRSDLVTAFPKNYIQMIRERDFKQTGERIRNREIYLGARLRGIPPELFGKKEDIASGIDLYDQWKQFLSNIENYSDFEIHFWETAQAINTYRIRNNKENLQRIVDSGERAIKCKYDSNIIEDREAANLLHYWLALAYLWLNRSELGIRHHDQLMQGIDAVEAIAQQNYRHQQIVVKEINEQEAADARFDKKIFGTIIAMAFMAGGAYFLQSSQYFNRSQFQQVVNSASSILGESLKDFTVAEVEGYLRTETSKFISPYLLKLNRYMDNFELVEYLLELGKGYETIGYFSQAITQFEEAAKIIENQRTTIYTEQQRISFFAAKQNLYDRIIPLLINTGQPDRALEYAEKAKSRAFIDLLGSTRLKLKTTEQTRIHEDQLNYQREMASFLNQKKMGADQLDQLVGNLSRAIVVKQEESVKKYQPNQEIRSLSTVQILSQDEIKKLAGSDADLIEYYITENSIIIMHITNDRVEAAIHPVDSKTLHQKAELWMSSIKNKKENLAFARYFYDQCIKPVESRLKSDNLVIFPHRLLHYLPFQAFYDGERYLIERYTVSYAPSATVLKLTKNKTSASEQKAIIIGNPTGDLAFAEKEARLISDILPGCRLLIKDQASETAIKYNAQDFGIIHFASHGEFNPKQPMASRILLSRDQMNDGNLTVKELFGVSWRASLVTLSGCETGMSLYMSGDELVGLQRGIFFAGAKSLISSLWQVDDEATYYLMLEFYKHLANMPKNQALQKAQIMALQKYRSPFYWAAFNLSGSPE